MKKVYLTLTLVAFLSLTGCAIKQPTARITTAPASPSSQLGGPASPAPKLLETPTPVTTTLIFGGDVMLSRNVGTVMFNHNDWELPWQDVASEFKAADVAFVNLESPFSDRGARITEGMSFKVEPPAIAGLETAGIDIVSLANNHFQNAGQYGMTYTFDILRDHQVEYVGADTNFKLAHQGKIIKANGVTIGFLAYSYEGTDLDAPNAVTRNGFDTDQLAHDVEALRPQVDILVVSMHGGTEYVRRPTVAQEGLAHTAVDHGADLIIGQHPHVIQDIETYKDKFIFYSLGNLIFDQEWSEPTRQGLVVNVKLTGKQIASVNLQLVYIDKQHTPGFVTDKKRREQFLEPIHLPDDKRLVVSNLTP